MSNEIKIVICGGIMPRKATEGAACYDLYVKEDYPIKYGRSVIDLGFKMQLPQNMAAIIKSRSGFASRGIEVMLTDWNGDRAIRIDADVLMGTADSDYRGNIGVIINVHDNRTAHMVIKKGTRIAQMQIVEVPETRFVEVDSLDETDRGDGGFGHTGTSDIIEEGEKPTKKAGRPRKKVKDER
jgi:dUTP diphosphatase